MATRRALGLLTRSGNSVASTSRAGFATSALARQQVAVSSPAEALPSPDFAHVGAAPDKLGLEFPPLNKAPQTHGIHVATLHLRAHYPWALDVQTRIALQAASYLKIPTSGAASLPTRKELQTVIKSPFVHKKSMENFMRKTHKRAIKVYDANPEVIDLWLRYLRRNAMGGVGMKAYINEYVEFGFASGEFNTLKGQLGGSEEGDIAKAAEEIVKAFGGLEFEEVKAIEEKKVEGEATKEDKVEAKEEVKESEVEAQAEEIAAETAEPTPAAEAEVKADAAEVTPDVKEEVKAAAAPATEAETKA